MQPRSTNRLTAIIIPGPLHLILFIVPSVTPTPSRTTRLFPPQMLYTPCSVRSWLGFAHVYCKQVGRSVVYPTDARGRDRRRDPWRWPVIHTSSFLGFRLSSQLSASTLALPPASSVHASALALSFHPASNPRVRLFGRTFPSAQSYTRPTSPGLMLATLLSHSPSLACTFSSPSSLSGLVFRSLRVQYTRPSTRPSSACPQRTASRWPFGPSSLSFAPLI